MSLTNAADSLERLPQLRERREGDELFVEVEKHTLVMTVQPIHAHKGSSKFTVLETLVFGC